ncbi:PEP-CTERM sorting domain-containing protein [Desulfobacter postgatei]|jgi:hypothetical protein|uniref:PEP-CTERM sorting domain-containing protein n=1 Tax=Desulfobacter postgatei TaxID=2293 RepID=UPI002A35FD81|nr:PEP-CTERM sorting domain-containing protein [Desulfobacter postgatei]MDX9963031.1 PEP-CTERM sorting domain-containing protein [Desulfobacter postgatei]
MKKLSLFLMSFLLLAGGEAYATNLIMPSSSGVTSTITVDDISSTDPSKTFKVSVANRSSEADVWFSDHSGYNDASNPDAVYDTRYSGYYIGTITAIYDYTNDNLNKIETQLESLIKEYLGSYFDIASWNKVDNPDTTGVSSGSLTVTTNDANANMGTWTTVTPPDGSNDPWVSFYTVKASTEFALYYVDPTQQTGRWSTEHILQSSKAGAAPEISHLTGIFGDPPDHELPPPNTGVAPEPGTMILLGFGLISVAGIGRRKIKK